MCGINLKLVIDVGQLILKTDSVPRLLVGKEALETLDFSFSFSYNTNATTCILTLTLPLNVYMLNKCGLVSGTPHYANYSTKTLLLFIPFSSLYSSIQNPNMYSPCSTTKNNLKKLGILLLHQDFVQNRQKGGLNLLS